MEGFDSLRVKKILNLPAAAEINMIIGWIREESGVYGNDSVFLLKKSILNYKTTLLF
jgi:hypothetical protein